MTNSQKQKQIKAMFGAYSKRLEKLYDQFIGRLTNLANRVGIDVEDFLKKDGLFRFDKYPELRQEYNEIFKDYVQKEVLAYRAGITDGVALAYAHDASVLSGFSVLSNKAITHARNVAAETFIRNRMNVPKGLNLSQLIWNYASQSKSEFEVAVSNVIADGLKKGTSAESLGRSVRQYLNNPDMMYRRYHRTILDANGNKKDIVKWRKRIVDSNGKVRFVEVPLEQVGAGHYRSSRKNANRLMRTEINTAYHKANAERWQLEPFVIGIMIELSPQHPEYDECDELKGRYPKDFIFTGWHPQCLCMSNPITIQGDEKKEFYRRLAAGEDMSNYESPNAVRDIPDDAKAWIDANREKFIKAGERGTLGWIWRDNTKYWRGQFSREELAQMGIAPKLTKRIKTEEEKAEIQRRWDERRKQNDLIIRTGKNVWNVADDLEYRELSGMKGMLRQAIIQGNVNDIKDISRSLAKGIAEVNFKAKIMSEYIPNVKKHLQNVTSDELRAVYESITNKVSFVESKFPGNLLKQADKYTWEAIDYLGGNMYGIQDKYPTTWKISQEAYLNLATKTKAKYEWQKVKQAVADLKAFDTKSPVIGGYITDLDVLLANETDLQAAQEILIKAEAKKKQILYDRQWSKKKSGKAVSEFSEERKNAAIWDRGNGQIADDTLFEQASKSWRAATETQKDAVYEYTHHYANLNEPLQGRHYYGDQTRAAFERKVKAITKYIDGSPLPEDMWFMRGDESLRVIEARINFAGGSWSGKLDDLVGKVMQEGGFMSTGSRRNSGIDRKITLNIFAPKGTKAAYVEPISAFGNGAERSWDGLQKFHSFSHEHETIFQRGTKLKITRVYEVNNKVYIDCEVIGQEVRDLSYVPTSNISY